MNNAQWIDEPDPAHDQVEDPRVNRLAPIWRALAAAGLIMFLLYSNLLMREFTRSNGGHGKTLGSAIENIFTFTNFEIAVISSLVGLIVVEYVRKRR